MTPRQIATAALLGFSSRDLERYEFGSMQDASTLSKYDALPMLFALRYALSERSHRPAAYLQVHILALQPAQQ